MQRKLLIRYAAQKLVTSAEFAASSVRVWTLIDTIISRAVHYNGVFFYLQTSSFLFKMYEPAVDFPMRIMKSNITGLT